VEGLDRDSSTVLSRVTLTGGPDLREDGRWDGLYHVVGLDEVPAGGETVRACIMIVLAGHDRVPRGALAVAVDDGRVLWEYRMGAKPALEYTFLADLDGDGRRELLVAIKDRVRDHGALLVLDPASGRQRTALVWPQGLVGPVLVPGGDGPAELLVSSWDGDLHLFRWDGGPPPWLPLPPALLVAIGAWWYLRRRRRSSSVARMARRQLLASLRLANHGATGQAHALQAYVGLLRIAASGRGDEERLRRRLADRAADLLDGTLPELREQLDMARLAGLDEHEIALAEACAARIEELVQETEAAPTVARCRAVADELAGQADRLAGHLRALRREILRGFRTDPAAVQRRVLDAHAAMIEKDGVTLDAPDPRVPPVAVAPEDLTFILDNLVANALQAMAGGATRRLSLTWEAAGERVVCRVADTGCGLPRDLWERALDTTFSTREGGGTGLPASREKLRACGGSLEIESSEVGRGTVFVLTLPVVEEGAA